MKGTPLLPSCLWGAETLPAALLMETSDFPPAANWTVSGFIQASSIKKKRHTLKSKVLFDSACVSLASKPTQEPAWNHSSDTHVTTPFMSAHASSPAAASVRNVIESVKPRESGKASERPITSWHRRRRAGDGNINTFIVFARYFHVSRCDPEKVTESSAQTPRLLTCEYSAYPPPPHFCYASALL